MGILKCALAIIVLLTGSCTQLLAQTVSPSVPDTVLNPHQRYWQAHRSELKLEKNSVVVSKEKIPASLKRTLQHNGLYTGWEDSPLYLDKNTSLYVLYIKKDSTITAYGFSDQGKAVTYDSYTVHEE